jgi:hypothetical protein
MNHHMRASLNPVIRIAVLLALLLAAAATAPATRATIRQMATSASAPTLIDGDIASSTTWRLVNSSYLVLKPIKVLATAILTLEAGVEVQFLHGAGIQIEGGLNAQGSHAQPITFVGNGNTIQWQGLRVVQPAANVTRQGVAINQALAALAIQPAPISAVAATRVDLLESLLDNNVVGDPTYCGNDPPPNPISAPPDIICGPVDFTPWTTIPAGRIILPNDTDRAITSAIGSTALGDDAVAATSVVTLTIPAQTFAQAVDLFVVPRKATAALPGQPTALSFEISAVANGLKLHQFANAKNLTVQINYLTADLARADAQKLTLYAYDQSLNNWSSFDIRTIPDPRIGVSSHSSIICRALV